MLQKSFLSGCSWTNCCVGSSYDSVERKERGRSFSDILPIGMSIGKCCRYPMVWTVMFLHRDGWMHWFKQAALPGCSTGELLWPQRWGKKQSQEALGGDVLVVPHLFSGCNASSRYLPSLYHLYWSKHIPCFNDKGTTAIRVSSPAYHPHFWNML